MSTDLPGSWPITDPTREPHTEGLNGGQIQSSSVNPEYDDYDDLEYGDYGNPEEIPVDEPTDTPEYDHRSVFKWNIQITSIVIIVVIGLVILLIFLISLWLSKRKLKKVLTPPSRMKALWTNIQIIPFKPAMLFSRHNNTTGRQTQGRRACAEDIYDPNDDVTDDSSPMVTESQCSSHGVESTVSNWNKPNCTGKPRHKFHEDTISCDIQPDPESSDLCYEDAEGDISLNLSVHNDEPLESINPPPGRTTSCSSSEDLLLYKIITV